MMESTLASPKHDTMERLPLLNAAATIITRLNNGNRSACRLENEAIHNTVDSDPRWVLGTSLSTQPHALGKACELIAYLDPMTSPNDARLVDCDLPASRLHHKPLASLMLRPKTQYSSSITRLPLKIFKSVSVTRNSSRRRAFSSRPKPGQSPLKIWPFIAITLLGTFSYQYLVKRRIGENQKPRQNTSGPFQ